jgi:S-adenosylmethionine hydrolase
VWTNIPRQLALETFKDKKTLDVTIKNAGKVAYHAKLPLSETFSAVPKGQPLLYFNSLLNLSLALNQGDFARAHKISSGPAWTIEVSAAK